MSLFDWVDSIVGHIAPILIVMVPVLLFTVIFLSVHRAQAKLKLVLLDEMEQRAELDARRKAVQLAELDVREKDLLGKQEVYNRRHAAREAEKEKEAQELAALDELERLKALRRS